MRVADDPAVRGAEREYLEDTGEGVPADEGAVSPAGQWDWLLSKTGAGAVSEYREHPLNWLGSDGLGRVLRGLTGMLGDLDYAIVDIVLGVVELVRPAAAKVDAPDG